MCHEKRQAFANISLMRNTVRDRMSDLVAGLDRMKHNVKSLVEFLVAIDKSTDVAQQAIFIRVVDEALTVTKEFLELVVPMTDATTAIHIFNSLT